MEHRLLPHALLGHAYAVSGQKAEAFSVLGELKELSKQEYVSPYRVAAIYAGLGETDQAFEWLEKAYQEHDPWLIWLNVDPVVDVLRSDGRLAKIAGRIGLVLSA